MAAPSRNSAYHQQFLQLVEDANPHGDIYVITDNLSSHNSVSTPAWLEEHPRIRHAFIPVGACRLNLQEGWWRLFRKTALAGRSFGDRDHITHTTRVATDQLNARARPWIRGRPAPPTRRLHRHPQTPRHAGEGPCRMADAARCERHVKRTFVRAKPVQVKCGTRPAVSPMCGRCEHDEPNVPILWVPLQRPGDDAAEGRMRCRDAGRCWAGVDRWRQPARSDSGPRRRPRRSGPEREWLYSAAVSAA
ncbi:transposase [Streptomyces sp. HC307]|uniref:transposase n=1 Tax=Streptomyces flavusporus TaxID=3385496 RepID=UPI0039175E33